VPPIEPIGGAVPFSYGSRYGTKFIQTRASRAEAGAWRTPASLITPALPWLGNK